MRKTVVLISLLLAALSASAQTTAVTATVVDSDSTAWANATWTLTFQVGVHQSNPAAYSIGGSPLSASVAYQSGSANGSGVISFTNYQSTSIIPVGSSWNLTVCPQASVPCTTINFSTSASTLSLSSQINAAIVAPRFTARANSIGYNDTEAQVQLTTGATYFNTTSNTQRCYTGSAWIACSANSGGPPTGAAGGALSGNYPNPTLATAYLPLTGGALTGAVTFPNSIWNSSADGVDRFNFAASGTTYLSGVGITFWENGVGPVGEFDSAGDFTVGSGTPFSVLANGSVTIGGGSIAIYRCSGGTNSGNVVVSPSTQATACTTGGGTLVSLALTTP